MTPQATGAPGIWGPPTASIDWCEQNYAHSAVICEFFNTVSSLAMLAAGAAGLLLHRRILEPRFRLAFSAVCLVGIGSAAFHASLRFEFQLLDELPMLYSALILVYAILENRRKPRFGPWLWALLLLHAVLVTALTALSRGTLQFYLFHLSFGSLEAFCLVSVFLIDRASSDPVMHRLFRWGMGAYALALVAWITDLTACGTLSETLPRSGLFNPELHAFWHVLVSVGLYLLVVLLIYERLRVLGRQPRVLSFLGIIPRVVPTPDP